MQFLALTLCLVAAVSYGQAATVEELTQTAIAGGALFTQIALNRINNKELWGTKRANSSMDVAIINKSGVRFNLTISQCSSGSFSNGLVPELNLLERTSTVFGVQSSKDNLDLGCFLYYVHPNSRTYFKIILTNTKPGENTVYSNYSQDLDVAKIMSEGINSQVRIVVSDRGSGPLGMVGLQGAALVPQRKPKGSRNKFVKASKSGSIVRTM